MMKKSLVCQKAVFSFKFKMKAQPSPPGFSSCPFEVSPGGTALLVSSGFQTQIPDFVFLNRPVPCGMVVRGRTTTTQAEPSECARNCAKCSPLSSAQNLHRYVLRVALPLVPFSRWSLESRAAHPWTYISDSESQPLDSKVSSSAKALENAHVKGILPLPIIFFFFPKVHLTWPEILWFLQKTLDIHSNHIGHNSHFPSQK